MVGDHHDDDGRLWRLFPRHPDWQDHRLRGHAGWNRFVAFLTAAVAQRFVAQIEEPKPEWEEGVLRELREIKARLAAIEGRIPG